MTAAQIEAVQVGRQFILAGRAIFTLVGQRSRFTFRVSRAEPTPEYPNPDKYFVSLMTGSDNENNYSYIGMLDPRTGGIRATKGSKIPQDAPGFVAASWAFPRIWQTGGLPGGGQVLHAGRCGRCARLLTTPESLAAGFGPECRDRLGIPVTKAEVGGGE